MIDKFKHSYQIKVQWGDMDALHHVNNTVYFKYVETARIEMFGDWLFEMRETKLGPILAFTDCQFLKAIVYPDTITVWTRIKEIKNTSISMEHEIISENLGICAKINAVLVNFDFENNCKKNFTDSIRKRLEAFM